MSLHSLKRLVVPRSQELCDGAHASNLKGKVQNELFLDFNGSLRDTWLAGATPDGSRFVAFASEPLIPNRGL